MSTKSKTKRIQGEGWDVVTEATKEAKAIAFDGCHKIYLCMDDKQLATQRGYGYGEDGSSLHTAQHFTPDEMLTIIKGWYENSCGLRFVEAVYSTADGENPNHGYFSLIPQFWDEGAEDWEAE